MASPYDSPQPVLTAVTDRGEKITLRPPDERDAEGLVIACSDAESTRWTTISPGYDLARAHGFITEYAPGWWQRHQGGCWVIADPHDAYAGQIDLRVSSSDPQVADVGFLTAPHARGRGYMTAALRTVARFGIRELGIQRVEWKAHVGNDGSRKVAERAGFQYEGLLRAGCAAHGRRFDAWLASLLPTDVPADATPDATDTATDTTTDRSTGRTKAPRGAGEDRAPRGGRTGATGRG